MKVYNSLLELIGQGIKIGESFSEENLQEGKEYVLIGAGILQRGWCSRDLDTPEGYDKFFENIKECEEYICAIERCGYGNTISCLLYTSDAADD